MGLGDCDGSMVGQETELGWDQDGFGIELRLGLGQVLYGIWVWDQNGIGKEPGQDKK